MRRALFVLLIALVPCTIFAQGYRGRDFWICFPQNAVIEQNHTLHLSIYITAESRAIGSITNLLDSTTQNFSVESGASIERDIDTEIEIGSSERSQRNSVHIVSDQDISVYVVDHRPASTDSYMAIPTEYLGKEYVVAGYTTLRYGGIRFGFTSQATFVATEDNTWIAVHLAGTTTGGLPKGRTLMFGLNRGETYQIQGGYESGDLTGSTISSTKPIAFFTGHRCAQVPSEVEFCDMLLESEPPANDWGKAFVLTKFEGKDYSVARVIANADSTQVSINGANAKTINRGEFYEVDTLYHDAIITTSRPALVAQYCTSSDADTIKIGDPFMLIAIPSDRFTKETTTTSVVDTRFEHFLNIVVPDSGVTSLKIDGMMAALGSLPPGVSLSSKRILAAARATVFAFRVPSGRHMVECNAPVAVYSYGFGVADQNYDSYGHSCGMRLDK